MNKSYKILFQILIVLMLLCYLSVFSVMAGYEDITVEIDTGVSVTLKSDNNGYYEIATANELYAFATAVNSGKSDINGKLMSDITVNTDVIDINGSPNNDIFRVWTPIGNQNIPFNGTFDGNGYTIYGLYITDEAKDYVGLFGNIGKQGNVRNIGVKDSFFFANNYVGAIVGNCFGNISDCYNTGNVTGNERVGGIVGYMVMGSYGNISNCYNTGDILGETKVGGIAGEQAGLELKNCYNSGAVKGNTHVGGIAGYFYCYYIANSYNIGSVSGSSNVGSLAGYQYPGSLNIKAYLNDSYYLSDTRNENGGRTKEDFASGEVAYLLGNAFGQKLSGESTNPFPVFSTENNRVYTYKCCGTKENYSNEEITVPSVAYENGFCSYCGAIGKLTEENYTQLGFTKENYSQYLGYAVIQNADNLYWLADYLKDGYREINVVLSNDITVNTGVLKSDGSLNEGDFRVWIAITEYNGVFDGNGKKIKGLYYSGDSDRVGLFAMLGKDAIIKNITITDSYFKGNNYVGGIVGYNFCGEITNCANIGTVIGNKYVGGLVGHNDYTYERDRYSYTTVWLGVLKNSYHWGAVNGEEYVGGVSGANTGGLISGCHHDGTVIGSKSVGGIVGYTQEASEFVMANQQPYNCIENCYNTGKVTGNNEIGGVVGKNIGNNIINCHNSGTIQGIDSVGGIVGYFDFGRLVCPKNSGEVIGDKNARNIIGYGYVNNDGHMDDDNDHKCDNCSEESVGSHIDENNDHKCDHGCPFAIGEHTDSDKNHICDYGCNVNLGNHTDANNDHLCDYGCTAAIGEHIDANNDHICDLGCTEKVGEHVDTNKDHICDYGCQIKIGNHIDGDSDHICDYGCAINIGNHVDENKDHICDHGCKYTVSFENDDQMSQMANYLIIITVICASTSLVSVFLVIYLVFKKKKMS